MKRLILTALALTLTPTLALAQTTPGGDARFSASTLDVSAYGEAQVPPDMATITLGVTDQARTASQAMADNAAAMTKVIAALKAGGIEARDIATTSLNLNPQYVYNQNQPPRLTGYEASNEVTVTVRDLKKLGAAVDAVVGAGATNVSQISYGLQSRVPAENLARLAAVKALEDKAALLADAAGYHIRRLVNLSENASFTPPSPRPLVAMARVEAAPTTPVESGELSVRVDVTGEFELTH
jgi:uncharacterized protein YggE